MSKPVAAAQDILDLIKSAHAAWPTLAAIAAVVVPFFVALPPLAIAALVALVLFLVGLTVYRVRRVFVYMPLDTASRIAYEQLDGTLWAAAAERMHDEPSPTNTLDYMGQLLINELEVFGTKPPSTVFRQISVDRLKRGAVSDQCKTLRSTDNKEPDWVDLAVKRLAFKRRVKELRAKDFPEPSKRVSHNSDAQAAPETTAQQGTMPGATLALRRKADDSKPLELLTLMVAAESGDLIIVETLSGTDFQVGKNNINKSYDARELAFLHDAVGELPRQGMIKLESKGKGFSMLATRQLTHWQRSRSELRVTRPARRSPARPRTRRASSSLRQSQTRYASRSGECPGARPCR
jgi:hypothetical protein